MLLYAAALEDKENAWFILLSDTTLPIRTFSFTYAYAMGAKLTFISVDEWPDMARYNNDFDPRIIPRDAWKKGAQWAMCVSFCKGLCH